MKSQSMVYVKHHCQFDNQVCVRGEVAYINQVLLSLFLHTNTTLLSFSC